MRAALSLVLLFAFTLSGARYVYVGSLNTGIWVYNQNDDGTLTQLSHPVTTSSGFLAVHPNGKNLYATGEGDVYVSYGIAGSNLIKYNSLPGHDGQTCWTTHVSVHPNGKFLFGANYFDGSYVAYSLWDNGALNRRTSLVTPGTGSHGDQTGQGRQDGPHAHMIVASPNPNFVVGMDLGADRIWVWKFDTNSGALLPNRPAAFKTPLATGPRHITFSPDGKFAYTVDEIACTILVLSFNSTNGTFKKVQVISSLQQDQQGDASISAGEIRIHPSGSFLYVTNRNGPSNNIGLFKVDKVSGMVNGVDWVWSRAQSPRGMNVDPSGRFLYVANEKTDSDQNSLFAFKIDSTDGKLSLIGGYNTGGSCSDVEFGL